MAKAMIVTLGTGQDVEKGLAKSIQTNNPDKLCFIATEKSLATIERIEAVLGRKLAYEPPSIISNPEDVEDCWKITRETICSVLQAGCHAGEIVVDFTSGTKAMSAGAALAAVSLEIGSLSYVGGGERDDFGRVISGTERVIILTPNEVFIDHHRRLIRYLFNSFQFQACLKLIEETMARTAAPDLQREFDLLKKLVLAYSWWDKFDHQKSASCFGQVPRRFDGRWRIDTSHSKEIVSRIARQRENYRSTGEIKDKFSEEILADLLANAERRAIEGKYDDAVARLYRAVEVIGQMLLARHNLDTSALSLENLPPEWRGKYRTFGEPIRLGQEQSFALLEALGEQTGRQYLENKNLRNYLRKRNNSILAHDLEPMTGNTYEELSREANHLAGKVFPSLSSLKEKSRFPPLG